MIKKYKPTRLAIKELAGMLYFCKSTSKNIEKYTGSGVVWKDRIKKYGKENIRTIWVSEWYHDPLEIQQIALHFSQENQIVESLRWANLKPENGLDGGDASAFIDYNAIDYRKHTMQGARAWWNSLTKEEQQSEQDRRHHNVCKGWYISRIEDATEIYVHSISKWCEEHNIDKSMPTKLNDPTSRHYQKQVKGWRIRRSDMPLLSPYIDKRKTV